VAEDLTAETFLAAVDAVRRADPPPVSTAWLVGVARHKLADHWRRQARQERGLAALDALPAEGGDLWEAQIDALRARDILAGLAAHHRAALTLRYLDDLSVPEVAALLHRTVHGTEALLSRARVPPSDAPTPWREPTMADPFEVLRLPVTAVDPDPAFTARLRSRLERALALPQGVTVSELTLPAPADRASATTTPATTGALVPYLIVAEARRAVDWYVSALGATRRGEVYVMNDGRIGHAELELRGAVLYLADESAESHVAAPVPGPP
jgi:RNA polymerase sigma-70 factor (ECF subfamily)